MGASSSTTSALSDCCTSAAASCCGFVSGVPFDGSDDCFGDTVEACGLAVAAWAFGDGFTSTFGVNFLLFPIPLSLSKTEGMIRDGRDAGAERVYTCALL